MRRLLLGLLLVFSLPGILGDAAVADSSGGFNSKLFKKAPSGIRCHDLECVQAFASAFKTSSQRGWRLYAIERGRRRGAAPSPAHFILSELYRQGAYLNEYWVVRGGEYDIVPIETKDGNSIYKIVSDAGDQFTWYIVPTKTEPPRSLGVDPFPVSLGSIPR